MPLHIFVAHFCREIFKPDPCVHLFSLTFQSLSCFPSLCLLKLLGFPPAHVSLGYRSLFVCPALKVVFSIWLVLLPLHSAYRLELLPLRQRFIQSFVQWRFLEYLPGTVLGAVDTAVNRSDLVELPAFMELPWQRRWQIIK